MKKISAVLAVALCCAGPALAAKPPKPVKPNPNLTIQASATSVTFRRSVTLSGTTKNIAAGTSVELQQNPYPYSGFRPAAKTAVVDPMGNWSIAGVVRDAPGRNGFELPGSGCRLTSARWVNGRSSGS